MGRRMKRLRSRAYALERQVAHLKHLKDLRHQQELNALREQLDAARKELADARRRLQDVEEGQETVRLRAVLAGVEERLRREQEESKRLREEAAWVRKKLDLPAVQQDEGGGIARRALEDRSA